MLSILHRERYLKIHMWMDFSRGLYANIIINLILKICPREIWKLVFLILDLNVVFVHLKSREQYFQSCTQ